MSSESSDLKSKGFVLVSRTFSRPVFEKINEILGKQVPILIKVAGE